MARLIDADELIYGLKTELGQFAMKYILAFIKAQPTVDPIKHGHWIFAEDIVSYIRCSECGDDICWVNTKRPKYCPNCGAKMDQNSGGDNNGSGEAKKE